ncbi:MAG: hypothetical protein ABIH04_10810 [Planctomycetota bacterium]
MSKVEFKPNDKVVFLPNEHTVGWSMYGLLGDGLFPGVRVTVKSITPDGRGLITKGGREPWSFYNFRLVRNLDVCPYVKSDLVMLDYHDKPIGGGPNIAQLKYITIDEGDFHIGWCEEELRSKGLEFDKTYYIENIEDDRIIYLKGVDLGFYWKFFKKASTT